MMRSNRFVSSALVVALAALPAAGALAAKQKKKAASPPAEAAQPAPAKKADVAKKAEERKGPASFNGNGRPGQVSAEEEAREAAADKKRDDEIEELKTVIKQVPSDSPQKADLIFQLAELYYEKSKYLYAREMRAYFAAQDAYAAKLDRGEKIEEPKLDNKQSELWRGEALRLYKQILKDYPTYERKDEVLFTLAYNEYEAQDPRVKAQAVQNYWSLIKQYPQSRFVPDAYVQLGEHFFNHNELEKARKAYTEALKSKTAKIYSFALYKLAWCDYNAGDYDGAINKFKQVIAYTEQQSGKSEGKKDRIQLKNEALNDLVLSFVQIEATDPAIQYFEQQTSPKRAHRLIQKLANALAESGKHESAIKVYRHLINADGNDVDAPSYQNAIVKQYEQLRRRDMVAKEMRVLVNNYGPKSSWAQINKDNKGALEAAYEATEGAMREMVTEYHQEAQRTKDVATYRLARDIYKEYLDNFGDSEYSFNLRFFYAEILWALQEWEPAAEQYSQVVDTNPGEYGTKDYQKTAAYDAILCYEKLAAIARGEQKQSELKDTQKINEKQAKGQVAKVQIRLDRHAADAKEEAIPQWEAKLVLACDKYVKVVPDAKDEITVRYKAAFIYYTHHHDVEAATRFGEIINKWPTDQWSRKAADLTLDILNTKRQWGELNKLAREFFANKPLIHGDKEFAGRLASLVEGSQYNVDEDLYKVQKKPLEAAVAFRGFVKEFPKSQYAPQALLYSMIIFQDANQIDQGIEVGEQLLKEYPGSKLVPRTHLYLGAFYDKTAQFAQSAKQYEAYVSLWEKAHGLAPTDEKAKKKAEKTAKKGKEDDQTKELDEKVADALFNAALWHAGMGEDEAAIAEYTQYVDYCDKKLPGFDKKADAPEVFFSIGLIHEKAKNWKDAAHTYEAYVAKYGKGLTAERVYFAKYKQLTALRQIHPPTATASKLFEDRDVQRLMDELAKGYAKLDPKDQQEGDVLNAYGHVRFLLLEPLWREYMAVRFQDTRHLVQDLKAKTKLMGQVEAAYTQVLATRSGEWGIAALTRIGLGYEDFAKTLTDSPDPKGLSEDQLSMYRAEIENKAFPLEEKAVEALQKALDKSFELHIYTEWTLKAEDQINKVRPGAFGSIHDVAYRGSEPFATAAPVLALAAPPAPPAPAAAPSQEKKPEAAPAQAGAGGN